MYTQLTSAAGFNTSNIIFSDPQAGSIPDSKPAISFKRINIQTRNPDGSIGDLILETEKLFSFGVSENVNMETGKVNGYVLPLCLYNKDCPSEKEKEWVTTFNNIVDKIKSHLINVRESIDQDDLDERDLKKLNPLYYKKEKGKIVDGAGPALYAKLMMSKKLNKIMTLFINPSNDQEIDPLELIGKFGFAKSAIKFESIFIGNKISLQIKVHECEYELQQVGFKRLLSARPVSKIDVTIQDKNNYETKACVLESDDSGSLDDSDSESDSDSISKIKSSFTTSLTDPKSSSTAPSIQPIVQSVKPKTVVSKKK